MGRVKPYYKFTNPNTQKDTAEALIAFFAALCKPRLEEAWRAAAEKEQENDSHPV